MTEPVKSPTKNHLAAELLWLKSRLSYIASEKRRVNALLLRMEQQHLSGDAQTIREDLDTLLAERPALHNRIRRIHRQLHKGVGKPRQLQFLVAEALPDPKSERG